MNYLAHFHLARSHNDWIAGALLGDFVKGPLAGVQTLPDGLRAGIHLHRRIDAFTDAHTLRAPFAAALPPEYRRYAGILLDMYCDHWLSRHWSTFEAQSLPAFSARVYGVLRDNRARMPTPAARMADRLIEHDVLGKYGEPAMIAATLRRIGGRLSRANPLRDLQEADLPALAAAEPVFLALYPQLVELAAVSAER